MMFASHHHAEITLDAVLKMIMLLANAYVTITEIPTKGAAQNALVIRIAR